MRPDSLIPRLLFGPVLLVLLIGLPPLGIVLTGNSPLPYLQFPPRPLPRQHAPFSPSVFIFLALLISGSILPPILKVITTRVEAASRWRHSFPFWGWIGLFLMSAGWWLAWHRYPWFSPVQRYTFLPLWLGYILTINGLIRFRTGHCPLLSETRHYLALFPLSAVFWWFFEYLNRFVANWHYLGVADFSAGAYVLHASLSFSTVLPAVLATEQFLKSFPRLTEPLKNRRPLKVPMRKGLGWLLLPLTGTVMLCLGIWPDYLFFSVWIAPLLIIVALQLITSQRTILAPLAWGDWQSVWLPAFAALICGFFWELWNYHSLAHWEYSVPFVDRFHLFAMPALGYAGYLPFGLECRAVADLIRD